jgi:hypothetical protein
MKSKLTSLVALSAGLLVSAQGQSMVAGWEFSQYANAGGFSTTDGATLTGQVNANFSARSSDNLGVAAHNNGFGVAYYDGNFGSTAFVLGTPEIEVGGDLGILGGIGTIGSGGEIDTLVAQGPQFGNPNALGLNTNGAVTFAVNMSGFYAGPAGEAWSLAFATQNASDPDNSSSIAWDYSLNGSDFISTGFNTAITNNAAAGSVDLSSISALDGQSVVYFRGTFSGIDGGVSYIDNFQVNATPVVSGETGGSLFILDNPASVELIENWYDTPMGTIFIGQEPWLWSLEYGWHYSQPENTPTTAYVYIQDAPFATWVFVDQTSATAQGFWGFAFEPADPALNGWFWFFNEASTDDTGSFFIWNGQQTLTFDDKSNPSSGTASEL